MKTPGHFILNCLIFCLVAFLGMHSDSVFAHSETMGDFEYKSKFSLGINGQYSDYKDSFTQHVQQYSGIGRLGLWYKPKNSTWIWSLHGYKSFGPESHTPTSMNPADFFGGEFTLNYPFGWKFLGWRPLFSIGWAYRGMTTAGSTYGATALSSPMVGLSFKRKYGEGEKVYLSFQYIPLLSPSFQKQGSEISVRLAHTLFRKWKEHPLYIFGEGSSFKINIQSQNKNATLFLASIGLIQEF